MLKTNKMKLHLKHFYRDYLKKSFENHVGRENKNTNVVIDFYMKRLLPTVSAGT